LTCPERLSNYRLLSRAALPRICAHITRTNDSIARDEIAARQAWLLGEHLGPREKKLRLIDVKEMFVQMKDRV
jgi:hypothetical protein